MEEVIEIGAAEEDNNVKLLKKCELCKREYRLYPSYSFIDPKPRLLPKMLPTCLHTFCHDCIEQRRRGLGIICPKCNKRRHFVHTMQLENNYDLLDQNTLFAGRSRDSLRREDEKDAHKVLYQRPKLKVLVEYCDFDEDRNLEYFKEDYEMDRWDRVKYLKRKFAANTDSDYPTIKVELRDWNGKVVRRLSEKEEELPLSSYFLDSNDTRLFMNTGLEEHLHWVEEQLKKPMQWNNFGDRTCQNFF